MSNDSAGEQVSGVCTHCNYVGLLNKLDARGNWCCPRCHYLATPFEPAAATGPVPPLAKYGADPNNAHECLIAENAALFELTLFPEPITTESASKHRLQRINELTERIRQRVQAQPPAEGLTADVPQYEIDDILASGLSADNTLRRMAAEIERLRQPAGSGELRFEQMLALFIPQHDGRQYVSQQDRALAHAIVTEFLRPAIAEAERKARLDEARWWYNIMNFSAKDANNPYPDQQRIAELERGK